MSAAVLRRWALARCIFGCWCLSWLGSGVLGLAAEPGSSNPTFDRDVMAVLSQAGCNMGACHGNLNGKGGFKLSLRGEDSQLDFAAIARQFGQRRIDVFEPDESLLLQKASGRLGHGGGLRLTKDSVGYRLLYDWMRAGAPGPDDSLAPLVALHVTPTEQMETNGGDEIPLQVLAEFADGLKRDVTNLAAYETSNTLVHVTSAGVVVRENYGEATVLVRYLDRQVPVRVAFVEPRADFVWKGARPLSPIDQFVAAKQKQLLMLPAEVCDDATFCRRVWLDIAGALPTVDDAQAFVADDRPDKRERLIDSLLARPEYADFWTIKWSDLLRTEEKVLDDRGVNVFHEWIHEQIARGEPLDAFVRQLLATDGSTYAQPPANFYRVLRDPTSRGETVARLFLGVRLQCARCHNHPFDQWTMDDYYSWSAVFARIDYKIVDNKPKDKLDKNEFVGEQIVQFVSKGELENPRTRKPADPKFLGAENEEETGKRESLADLSQWITSPENELFAKAQANLIWYHLLGRGLIDPIDDVRATNPPSHPELLDWLADELVDRHFDQRQLIRTICSSATYQLSAEVNDTNRHDTENYTHAIVRRLTAEQLVDAQSQTLGVWASFNGYPDGTWARQIRGVMRVRDRDKAPSAGDQLLRTFGKNPRLTACECERSNDATLQQAFILIGSEPLEKRLEATEALPAKIAAQQLTNAEVADQLYWQVLGRSPSSAEVSTVESWLESTSDRQATLVDLTWALLNSKEFLYRH